MVANIIYLPSFMRIALSLMELPDLFCSSDLQSTHLEYSPCHLILLMSLLMISGARGCSSAYGR